MYAQMLVGMVGTTGQWWLDARKPAKEVVAAHLVNLAWNGLSGLETNPTLQTELRQVAATAREPTGRGSARSGHRPRIAANLAARRRRSRRAARLLGRVVGERHLHRVPSASSAIPVSSRVEESAATAYSG